MARHKTSFPASVSAPRRAVLSALLAALALCATAAAPWGVARADEPLPVVASFSILSDLVKQVGGERVSVQALVGPDGDAHVFSPAPADAKKLAAARLIVVNGLGLEGWIQRLIKASGTTAPVVVASTGVKSIKGEDEDHPGHEGIDPHAWQNVGNAEIYVANIRDALIKADPAGKDGYEARATAYLAQLSALDGEVKAAVATIPADRRRIITTHDAFGYFAKAYGLEMIAPQGVSTESEASAKDVARVIAQIRRDKVPAVFLENISDPRLMQRIAGETHVVVGGKLFSDALSPPDGPASTYVDMIRYNVAAFKAALAPKS
jgi:zinc/manganese transport system substrate-binding protein